MRRAHERTNQLTYIERQYRGNKYQYMRDQTMKNEYDVARTAVGLDGKWSSYFNEFTGGMSRWHKSGQMVKDRLALELSPFKQVETATIGYIPAGLMDVLWRVNPDFLKDKRELYKWFKRFPMFASPKMRSEPIPEVTR